jgi:putative ABC transport system ATP-binding protein
MLVLENICLDIGCDRLAKNIFNGLNLYLKKGEIVSVIGGNGAGKSTLMNVVAGLLKPQKGKIILENQDITFQDESLRSKMIARVLQNPSIGTLENMTIYENMVFAMKRGQKRLPFLFGRSYEGFCKDHLVPLSMGLENRLHEKVLNLSGGQKQGLSLVMSLLSESKVLLLDEMTSALDPQSSKRIIEFACERVRSLNLGCLMVSHNMDDCIDYSDRILLLKNGAFQNEFSKNSSKKISSEYLKSFIE